MLLLPPSPPLAAAALVVKEAADDPTSGRRHTSRPLGNSRPSIVGSRARPLLTMVYIFIERRGQSTDR